MSTLYAFLKSKPRESDLFGEHIRRAHQRYVLWRKRCAAVSDDRITRAALFERACTDRDTIRILRDKLDNAKVALSTIAEATFCPGPGCPMCEADEPHPPSAEAKVAIMALNKLKE